MLRPGNMEAADPVLRALTVFENSGECPDDSVVYKILELLCRSRMKVRQGRGSVFVDVPVDFSDLSSNMNL